MEQPVILSAVRTPIGKFQGGLASLSATELGARVVAEAVRRAAIEPQHVDELRRQSDLPITVVSSTLAMLELKGLVRQVGGMMYVVAREDAADYRT